MEKAEEIVSKIVFIVDEWMHKYGDSSWLKLQDNLTKYIESVREEGKV